MDKLREILAPVLRQSFWIMCVGILLTTLYSWWSSTQSVQQMTAKNLGIIKTKFDGVQGVPAGTHPNEITYGKMGELANIAAKDLGEAWQTFYENQKGVLVWPKDKFDDQFIQAVSGFRPIELKAGPEYNKQISEENRRLYRDYADQQVPLLSDIVRAMWEPKAGAAGGEANGMAGMMNPNGMGAANNAGGSPASKKPIDKATEMKLREKLERAIVFWRPENQSQLKTMHFNLTEGNIIPTTIEILYFQEDLWVLQALLHIIAATNRDAEARHEAAIKTIDYIKIGKGAGALAGKISPPGAKPGEKSGGQGGYGDSGPAGGAMPLGAGAPPPGGAIPGGAIPGGGPGPPSGVAKSPSPGGADSSGAAKGQGHPADSRYVDLDYKPLSGVKLVQIMKAESSSSRNSNRDLLLAVAKRMPVRMHFRMDQRKLTLLLSECANSPLPVEVRQVRINRGAVGKPNGGGGMEMLDNAMSAPGMMGGATGNSGGADGVKDRSDATNANIDPNEVDVELYGIVYIYNPVNQKLLGSQTVVAAAKSPTPAVTPAAAGVPKAGTPAAPAKPPVNPGAANIVAPAAAAVTTTN